jgi:hypothetical protein
VAAQPLPCAPACAAFHLAHQPADHPTPLLPRRPRRPQALVEGASFSEPYDAALQGAAAGPGAARSNAGPWLAPLALAYLGVAALKVLGR